MLNCPPRRRHKRSDAPARAVIAPSTTEPILDRTP